MAIGSRAAAFPVLNLSSSSLPPPPPLPFSMAFKPTITRPLPFEKALKKNMPFLVSGCANWGSLGTADNLLVRPQFHESDYFPLPKALKLVEENDYAELAHVAWQCRLDLSEWEDGYRVLLIDDARQTERLVEEVLPQAVPFVTKDTARKLFHIARKNCFAVVTTTGKANAELIAIVMMLYGLRSAIVPASKFFDVNYLHNHS